MALCDRCLSAPPGKAERGGQLISMCQGGRGYLGSAASRGHHRRPEIEVPSLSPGKESEKECVI